MEKLAQMLQEVDEWDDEVLVGQLFSVASGGHAATDILGFGGAADAEQLARVHQRLKDYIVKYHLGAVIYFPPAGDHEPVENIRRANLDLQSVSELPLLIATDQENGTVARVRVGATHLPGAMALAATGNKALARKVAATTAEQLRAVGIFQTLAPVADINMISANPGVNIRSAGSSPEAAAEQIVAVVEGLQDGGVATTLKHFPGYGSAAVDPHLGLPSIPVSLEEWNETERLPFKRAIEAGADAVMLGHVTFPAVDPDNAATFSPAVVQGLLRDDLGFEGVIVTDAMDMGGADRPEGPAEACVMALQAGADQVLMPVDLPQAYDAVLAAVKDGRLARQQLRTSAKRILSLKDKLHLDRVELPDLEVLNTPQSVELARTVAAESIAIRNPELSPVLHPGSRVVILHPGRDPQKRGVNPGTVLGLTLEDNGHVVDQVLWGGSVEEGGPEVDLNLVPEQADEAVVVLRDGWRDDLPVAQTLTELVKRVSRIVVIATRSPHDSTLVPRDYPLLVTYGDNKFALEAAANVLIGKASARGGHPMTLSDSEAQNPENN